MTPEEDNNGWAEWKNFVLADLKAIKREEARTANELVEIKVEIAKLQVKSAVWGAMAGSIPVIVLLIIRSIS